MKAALLAAVLATSVPAVRACGEALGADARALAGDGWQLAWHAAPSPIPVGRHFVLDIALCAPAGQALPATLHVDATMPEHRHGMNYRPSVQALGGGLWRAEGLLWHMAGRWELRLDVEAAGATHALRQSVTLK